MILKFQIEVSCIKNNLTKWRKSQTNISLWRCRSSKTFWTSKIS